MKKNKLSKYLLYIFILILMLTDIVFAEVTSKLHFCEYPGVLRALKIVGIVIIIAKIVAPLLLIYSGISNLLKVVLSGKQEDLSGTAVKLFKKVVAGLIIFIIPSVIDYAFDELVDAENSKFGACTTCILDTSHCVIPEEDPVISTRD